MPQTKVSRTLKCTGRSARQPVASDRALEAALKKFNRRATRVVVAYVEEGRLTPKARGCRHRARACTILVESPDRFARDLAVQLAGHDMLRALGTDLIPASAPDFFIEDTPTAVLVRQVLGALAQFDKATTVAKLAAARKRKTAATGRCEGRKPLGETNPEAVTLVRRLRRKRPKGGVRSLREISAALAEAGHVNERGRPYAAASIASMLKR